MYMCYNYTNLFIWQVIIMQFGVVTDIHNNLTALKVVIEKLQQLGCDKIICCGDIIGIGPYPEETVQYLMQIPNLIAVRGNHEKYLLDEMPTEYPNEENKITYVPPKLNESEEEKAFIVKCYENMPPLPGRIIRVTDAYAANSWQRLFSKDNLLWHIAPQGYILAVDKVIGEVAGVVDVIPAGVNKAFLSVQDAAYSQLLNFGWQKDLPPQALQECWDGEVAMMKIFHPEKIPAKLFFPLANKF